jgi:hypothetical protein
MIKVPFADALQLDTVGGVVEEWARPRLPIIAESIVNVFPKPISSARIPPNVCGGTVDFLVPTIICS